MERSTLVNGAREIAEGHVALLRLRRGRSTWGTWAFESADAGTAITVGTDASCDWTIGAPELEPTELFIVFTGQGFLVKNGRSESCCWLDGAPLTNKWTPFGDGARLDFGRASLEVQLSAVQKDSVPARSALSVSKDWASAQGAAFARNTEERTSSFDVWADADDGEDACGSVLGEVPSTAIIPDAPRFAALGLITACAYALWIMLLDRI